VVSKHLPPSLRFINRTIKDKDMNIQERAKEQLETRLQQVENFISTRGVGSRQLERAKRIQRNANLALLVGGSLFVSALAIWMLSNSDEEVHEE
jgi:hypothetical protein